MTEKNIFGGKNPNSLYVPMSETEQEVLDRLKGLPLEVKIVDWGAIEQPRITFGDLRLRIPINITFDRPEVHMPVSSLKLELWIRNGPLVFAQEYSTIYNNQPLMIGSGVNINMIWDVAIQQIDKNFVKMVKPGAVGLTSRVGNMKLNSEEKDLYHILRNQEKKIRRLNQKEVEDAKNGKTG